MDPLASFLGLCVFCTLGPANSGLIVQAAPVADRLQKMITAIEPSFSKGLIHLSNLFDFVLIYDVSNGRDDENATLPIQTVLQTALISLSKTENITSLHLKMYEENVLSLFGDISEIEKQLRNETTLRDILPLAWILGQPEVEDLRLEIAELDAKVSDADQRASQSQRKVERKRKNWWKWITATVLTGELASPSLIMNEKDIQKLKRDRDAWQAQANERRQRLQIAENEQRDIISRLEITKHSIQNTRASLSTARTTLGELRQQYSVLSNLRAQIRDISTFLFSLNGELSVIHGQQRLMVLFQPLLESIDSLITFLEGNVNTIVLLANNEAVNNIRGYLSLGLTKGLLTEGSVTDQDKNDRRIKKLESELDAKIEKFQLDSDARLKKQFQLDSKKFFDTLFDQNP